ncbi:7-deoxyloganetic acid glucosyltransferase-like [Vitis riparia]|uniref:7-deoxyloganetic acid glucosyltransferase-like n=1 Tax=Vitis riparia TaxID=96939 RepID=UPI00155A5C3F|nr:7-deoxyloganetic acid glucosyltransferase-like [Vitis riparia]
MLIAGDGDIDAPITCIPGLETVMCRKDLSDRRCVAWLESQASRSVVHVSFGSIEALSRDQLLEVWHGLVNSGKPFLWVLRPDSVAEKESDFVGTLEKLERACIVGWAPQEEVLLHPAVGGFLSHCGRSSVIEGILGRVPMICWPQFGDHHISTMSVRGALQVWPHNGQV